MSTSKIKEIKIREEDGSYSDAIPIGADAENIDTTDGESVELKLNKKPYYYNNVADMKADTKLKAGDMAITLGYYSVNDCGAAEYKIVNTASQTMYQEELQNGLYANLIIDKYVIPEQFGAYGDGAHDDTIAIQNAIKFCNKVKLSKIYYLNPINDETVIYLKDNILLDFKNSKIILDKDTYPYYPLFVIDGKENITINNLTIEWKGALHFQYRDSDTQSSVTRCGITTNRERNFACFIAITTCNNVVIDNLKVYGLQDTNVYDSIIRGFSTSANITVKNANISHYNNAFSDGLNDSIFINIKGSKRSNYVDNSNGNAYYGPSHMFYGAFNNSIIENIKEIGNVLEDGVLGGATIQLVSSNNTKVNNILTNMKNTPCFNYKENGNNRGNNNIINNISCDCSLWDNAPDALIPFEIQSAARFYNSIVNNVIISNFTKAGMRISGNKLTVNNVNLIYANAYTDGNYQPLSIISIEHSIINCNLFNSNSSTNGVLIGSSKYNNIKIKSNNNLYFTFGTYNNPQYNDIITNKQFNALQQTIGQNKILQNGTIKINNTFEESLSHTISFVVPIMANYMVTVEAGKANHRCINTYLMSLSRDGSNKFTSFELINSSVVGNNTFTITPTITNNSDYSASISLDITASSLTMSNVNVQLVPLSDMLSFYNLDGNN